MPELPDERLSAELQRRATLARSSQDWAHGDLPDGVLGALRAQPAPVPSSRASRWLALAAVAVVLVLLVVALPSLPALIGPGQPSASPSPGGLTAMTTRDFAARLATGELDGQTVLVDGSIVAYDGPPIFGGLCGHAGPSCLIGELGGVPSRITVYARDVAVTQADSPSTQLPQASSGPGIQPATEWPFWKRVEPPITGVLVLSVGEQGGVEYLGRVLSGDPVARSASAVQSQLDVNSRALEEVVPVDAWLTGYFQPVPCPSASPGPLTGLLSLGDCGRASFLEDAPVKILPPLPSYPGLQVQADAFASFAPDPTARSGSSPLPQRAVYLLARRLYRNGCLGDSAPCWNWAIVGRLSQLAPEVAPTVPSTPPTPTIGPSAPPGARLMYCGGYVLTDYTGIVADCAAAPELVRTAVPTAVNPNGDLRLLDVTWTGDACTPLVELQFRWSGTHYRLNDQENAPADSASMPCIGPAIPRGVHLVLSQSLAADSIELTVYGQPLLTPAPASATPTANAPVTGTDSSGDFTLTISSPRSVYSTGEAIDVSSSLVADADVTVSCLGFSGIGLHQTDGPLNFSPGPFILGCTGPRTLQVGVPVTDEFADVWALSDPDPIGPHMHQGKLYLPPGTYQFINRASFYLGGTLGGDHIELTASIGITVVGDGATPAPTATVEPVPTGYSVKVDAGLQPKWNAQAAAQAVFDQIKTNERVYGVVIAPAQIMSVEAMLGKDVPSGIGGPYRDVQIAWVVHARGTFLNDSAPNPSSFHYFSDGWYVFADNGSLMGVHLEGQQPTPSASAP